MTTLFIGAAIFGIVLWLIGCFVLRREVKRAPVVEDEDDEEMKSLLERTYKKLYEMPKSESLTRPLSTAEIKKTMEPDVKRYTLDYLLREGLVDIQLCDRKDGDRITYLFRTSDSPNKVQLTPIPDPSGNRMLLNEVTGEVLIVDGPFLEKYGVRRDKLT